jgi:SAM-dependent methyltransferase
MGVDMTGEQLAVARSEVDSYCKDTLGYAKPNMSFVEGYIEFLEKAGVEPESKDLVISNCVINLSPDKRAVIEGVYDSLRWGGEFYFSDVYCDRRLSEEVRNHEVLLGECLGGALYIEDFRRICTDVGFLDPRQLAASVIEVTDPELKELCGEAKFYSITYRCFKLKGMETLCEDYGQVAYYKGTMPEHPHTYELDDHHVWEKNRPMLVCGNTAAMVEDSWMGEHFEVVGNRDAHYGLFDCGPAPASPSGGGDAPAAGGACC